MTTQLSLLNEPRPTRTQLKPLPPEAIELPTLVIHLTVADGWLLLPVTVARLCDELEANLDEMEAGDLDRIENLWRRAQLARGEF